VEEANCKLIKHAEVQQLRQRATFFKRLAVGAADPKFATNPAIPANRSSPAE
jgi:hypothetical protein